MQAALSSSEAAEQSYREAFRAFSRVLEIAPNQENLREILDELQQTMAEGTDEDDAGRERKTEITDRNR
ncbi:MAG: hypothetical protein D6812_01440 [Deltaproteobacteria bacterium]|nr:MAG: hypothetical protein D6812_01440 [Deltaproteobacteria bacterium]